MSGISLAAEIKENLKNEVDELAENGIKVSLGTVLVGEDVGSVKYVAGKHKDASEVGIHSIQINLPVSTSEKELLCEIQKLNSDKNCTGYIVQLPLPKHINQNAILEAIDPNKDADGLHPFNLGKVVLDVNGKNKNPEPCTPLGCIALIERYLGANFLDGKTVCVVGRGITIGRSIASLLTKRSINSTVFLTHTGTKDLSSLTKQSDVIIACAGAAHLIKPEMIKDGVVLLDVGVSMKDGKIAGDIHPSCHEKALAFSPNPGGVGPMTRAMLIQNVVQIAKQGHSNQALSDES